MKVHEILRSLRRQKNLTLENIASELDITYSTYQSYEGEKSKIQVETLERIAKFYNLTLIELLSYDDRGEDTYAMEPYIPYSRKKERALKVIIELDGTDTILNFWFKRLTSINSAL